MTKLSVFLLMLIVVMGACKKSGSDGIDGKTCKILVMSKTSTSSGIPGFTGFYYDNSGNLTCVKYFAHSGDTTVGPQYFYNGNILRYSIANINNDPHDTIFYFFDGTNKLVSTIEHWGTSRWKREYFYNSANQVELTLSRNYPFTDTTQMASDSTVYSYAGNNVYQLTDFIRKDSGLIYNYTRKFFYDGGKNYYKAMGKPPVSYLFWSGNNITDIKSADNTIVFDTFTYLNYNESGYPTEFIESNNGWHQDPFTVRISYECH